MNRGDAWHVLAALGTIALAAVASSERRLDPAAAAGAGALRTRTRAAFIIESFIVLATSVHRGTKSTSIRFRSRSDFDSRRGGVLPVADASLRLRSK